jgi:hypothetical protein
MQKDEEIVDPLRLAEGQISDSDRPDDKLTVVLIKGRDGGEHALIIWPPHPTQVSPVKLADTIARVCRILANSNIELAGHRVRRRW